MKIAEATTTVKKAAVKKTEKKGTPDKKAKRLAANRFDTYISRAIKHYNESSGQNITLAKPTVSILNSMINDIFQRLCEEAAMFSKNTKNKTLKQADIEAAVKMIFHGQMCDQILSAGNQTVQLLNSLSDSDGKRTPSSSSRMDEEDVKEEEEEEEDEDLDVEEEIVDEKEEEDVEEEVEEKAEAEEEE